MPASGVTKRSIAAGFLSEIQIRPSGPTLCGANVKSDREETKRTEQSVLIKRNTQCADYYCVWKKTVEGIGGTEASQQHWLRVIYWYVCTKRL